MLKLKSQAVERGSEGQTDGGGGGGRGGSGGKLDVTFTTTDGTWALHHVQSSIINAFIPLLRRLHKNTRKVRQSLLTF